MRSNPPASSPRRRHRWLRGLIPAFVLVLATSACGGLDPLLGSDEGASSGGNETGITEDTDTAGSPEPPPKSAAVPDEAGGDEAAEQRGSSSVTGGVGGGTVTIDGTTIELDQTLLCEPPDGIAGEGTGVQEMMDSMETMNLHSPSDEGHFAVYLADLGFRSLSIEWDPGSGDARYTADFADIEGDGSWLDAEAMDEPKHDPLQVSGDRATGTATLRETSGNGLIEVSFDLPIPSEASC